MCLISQCKPGAICYSANPQKARVPPWLWSLGFGLMQQEGCWGRWSWSFPWNVRRHLCFLPGRQRRERENSNEGRKTRAVREGTKRSWWEKKRQKSASSHFNLEKRERPPSRILKWNFLRKPQKSCILTSRKGKGHLCFPLMSPSNVLVLQDSESCDAFQPPSKHYRSSDFSLSVPGVRNVLWFICLFAFLLS